MLIFSLDQAWRVAFGYLDLDIALRKTCAYTVRLDPARHGQTGVRPLGLHRAVSKPTSWSLHLPLVEETGLAGAHIILHRGVRFLLPLTCVVGGVDTEKAIALDDSQVEHGECFCVSRGVRSARGSSRFPVRWMHSAKRARVPHPD